MAEQTQPATGGVVSMPPLCGCYCPTHCPAPGPAPDGLTVHITSGPQFATEAEAQAYYERLVERYIVPAIRRQAGRP